MTHFDENDLPPEYLEQIKRDVALEELKRQRIGKWGYDANGSLVYEEDHEHSKRD